MLLAKAVQKTRGCPHCGYTIQLQKARKLGSANTANEASLILRKMKSDAGARGKGLSKY